MTPDADYSRLLEYKSFFVLPNFTNIVSCFVISNRPERNKIVFFFNQFDVRNQEKIFIDSVLFSVGA